jgi:3-(methylthio)propionyl---CoA ligase
MNGLMMDAPLLISQLIEFGAQNAPDAELITRTVEGPVHRYGYADAHARIKRLANALLQGGVKPGDRLATIAWNTHRHFELYFAVTGIGAILHTINPRLGLPELEYVVNHAEDTHVFFDTTFAKLVAAVAPKAPTVKHWVALTDAAHAPAEPNLPALSFYESWVAQGAEELEWPSFDERSAATLCYTSGTTGRPKGVLYSHRSTRLHTSAVLAADGLGLGAKETVLPVVPMFHVNAWGVPFACAGSGARLVFPGPGLDGKSLFELMEAERVTIALGVPTVWLGLAAYVAAQGKRFNEGMTMVIGGSALAGPLRDTLEGLGAQVVHAWGMTETSPLGTVSRPLRKHVDQGSAVVKAIQLKQGRPLIGVEVRAVDDDGKVLPRDGKSSGNFQIRGPWIASGYFKDPSPVLKGGWFDTGDVGTLDADWFMQITDRSKDIIKSGGEWVSSVDLENEALGAPGVALAAVIGVPHPKWSERPLLIVVPKPGVTPSKEDILSHLATRVPKWWLPDAIEFVEAIPIGPTGKIMKRLLREKFQGYALP